MGELVGGAVAKGWIEAWVGPGQGAWVAAKTRVITRDRTRIC